MAGQNNRNVIEYVFEGNTLDLQAAIKQVTKLLNSSIKNLKKYQKGALTNVQQAQVKSTRELLKRMKDAKAKEKDILTEKQKIDVIRAGKQALKNAGQLERQTLHAKDKAAIDAVRIEKQKAIEIAKVEKARMAQAARAAKEQARIEKQQAAEAAKVAKQQAKIEAQAAKEKAEKQLEIKELLSTAGQESAAQHATFLENYSNELRNVLSPEAYNELKIAIANYRAAASDTTITEEELANATRDLQTVFRNYSETLRTAKQSQSAAQKGLTTFKAVLVQFEREIEMTVSSLHFWINALRKTVQIIKDGISSYADYVESLNFLNAAVKDSNEGFNKFLQLQRQSFGLDPTQLNTTASIFYSFGNSLGFASDQTKLISMNMTQLAADLASMHNTDLETMTSKLRSALAGRAHAIAKLGISVHDATIEEWLLTKGINDSMRSMSEASQAAARYAFIIEKSTAAQGDLAKTINSPANQMKILATQAALAKQNLGSLFVNVLMPGIKIINAILQPLNALVVGLTSLSAVNYSSSIGEGADSLEDLADASQDASFGLTSLDEINQGGTSGSNSALAGISDQISELLKGYDNLADGGSTLTAAMEKLGKALAPIWKMLTSNPIDFGKALSWIGDLLYPIGATLGWLFDLLTKFDGFLGGWLSEIIGSVAELAAVLLLVASAITIVKTLMASKIWTTFSGIIKGMITSFKSVAAAIWSAIKALVKWIAESIIAMAKAVIQTIKNWALAGSYWKIAVAAIAAAGVAALVVMGVVMSAAAVTEAKAQNSMSQLYGTPIAAKGGVTFGPTLALVGEGQYKEAIIPLGNSPQFKSMKQDIAESVLQKTYQNNLTNNAGAKNRSSNTPIILQINGKEMARALLPDLGYAQPQTGVKLIR